MLAITDVVTKIPALSPTALTLFRNPVERQGEVLLNDTNRPVYEELAAAGLMMAGHSFTQGRNSFYTLTKEGSSGRVKSVRERMTARETAQVSVTPTYLAIALQIRRASSHWHRLQLAFLPPRCSFEHIHGLAPQRSGSRSTVPSARLIPTPHRFEA